MDYEDQTSNTEMPSLQPGLAVGCLIVGIFLSSCAGYVMASLIVHGVFVWKKNKAQKNTERSQSMRAKARKSGTKRLSRWLGYFSLASAIFCFLNCVVDIPSIYLKETTNKTCKVMMTFSFIFYPCGVTCVYSFLWIRQRVFYTNNTLALRRSKYLRWVSFAVLPVFYIFMLSGLVSTIVIYDYETSTVGCIEVKDNNSPKILLFVGILIIQATLLGLFVYPLIDHSHEMEDELPENKLLIGLVRRACMTTGICFIADCTAFIIVMTRPAHGPTIVVNLIRDGNLLVNVICIVCSFVDWKDRLAPVCRLYRNDNNDDKRGEIRLVKSLKSSSLGESRKSNRSIVIDRPQEPLNKV